VLTLGLQNNLQAIFLSDINANTLLAMQTKRTPVLARLHQDTRQLLTRAAEEQRRSLSSIIDQCVRDQLQPRYGELQPRLQRFLMGVKQP
jgi:hypothetical protein